MDDEKMKIGKYYPEWFDKSIVRETKEHEQRIYYNRINNSILIYAKDSEYTDFAYVPKDFMNSFNDKLIAHIATPYECTEILKIKGRDKYNKGIKKFCEKVADIEDKKKEGGIVVPLQWKVTQVNNDWIPGNEPIKQGYYEITTYDEYELEEEETAIDFYWPGLKKWSIYNKGCIIAYRPFHYKESKPYKPVKELTELEKLKKENEEQEKYQKFGKDVFNVISENVANESCSEEDDFIMGIAKKNGLAKIVPYNSKKHFKSNILKDGDSCWVWGDLLNENE